VTAENEEKRVPAPPELPPSLANKWRMAGDVGKGGQGRVYRLCSLIGEPDHVIKFLLGTDDYSLERFRREAATLAAIKHPNILPLREYEMEPVPFYVAPLGEPLPRFWQEIRTAHNAAALFDRSASMILDLTRGLVEVHARGLVHRDIKPANIIILDGERPVLADFGIVHVPEAERITKRPAGNQFARDLAALYDPNLAPPAGDCLCMANLWAWLLACDPHLRHGNYHWRFHRFVEDERCEIARTVLALCSEPSACPKTASELVDLLDKRFLLSKLIASLPQGAASPLDGRAYALASAQSAQSKVAMQSEVAVLALAIAPLLAPLVNAMRAAAGRLSAAGMPADFRGMGLSDPLTDAHVARALLSSESHGVEHVMAQVICGDDNTFEFGARLGVDWHRNPHQDKSRFSVHLQFFHEAANEIDLTESKWHKVLPSGEIESFVPDEAVTKIRTFFEDGSLWVARTRPKPRGGGAFLG
jgi:hypothetical protein